MTDRHRYTGGFDSAFELLMEFEGGWANDPHDRSSLTRWGISSRAHPDVDLNTLTIDQAKAIYRQEYWMRLCCDRMPAKLAIIVFDWAVHSGTRTAALKLQTRLPVKADGIIGPKTLEAAWNADQRRLKLDLLQDRGDMLVMLGTTAGQQRFLKGWIRRLVALAGECLA